MLTIVTIALLLGAGPAADATTGADSPHVATVKSYYRLRGTGEKEKSLALLSHNSRIWFETKDGPGRKRDKSTGGGPWAEWDRFFNGKVTPLSFEEAGDSVTVRVEEINDFYRLIERPARRHDAVYYFDTAGKISGTLIRRVQSNDEPPDRFDEFKAWAAEHRPADLAYLMPDGEIVPDRERATRWKSVLNEWRRTVGLKPID